MLSLINEIARREPQSQQFYEESFYTYVSTHYRDVLTEILKLDFTDVIHPLKIKYIELFSECQELAEDLMMFPLIVLPECDKAAKRALNDIFRDLRDNSVLQLQSPSRCNLRVRVFSLLEAEPVNYRQIPPIKDAGTFICLRGTVVRSVTQKLLEYSKAYKCSKCKQQFWVDADVATFYTFPKVESCENKCVGAKIQPLTSEGNEKKSNYTSSKYRDYQEVKLQEADRKTALGTAKTIWVILEDDLVDTCKPGDDVCVCGTAILRWKPSKADQTSEVELAFLANYVEVNNDQRDSIIVTEEASQRFKEFWQEHQYDPYVGRNKILKSFCPNIYGMYVVKLALSVILCGGVGKEKVGSKIRGESHLLLVGDPGTGKSQFLQYANMLCPRSILTTGIGTTNAGLTVSASKVGGEWQLEAGALVLADGGVCCIDEFSCIKEHDRTSIHEAMEQQSVSVAKAGMVCKLNTRCTIIGSTNPKGKYDPKESVPFNVGLATPLLSRFDVLLVLRDAQNETWDSFLSDFVLRDITPAFSTPAKSEDSQCPWTTEQLQSYFAIAKELRPQMTDEATRVLSSYYQYQRNVAGRNKARTTVRLLESLVRLSEGHAKFMHREKVMLHDAITAITLVESSMLGSALIGETNTLHTSFPANPKEEYYKQAKLILNGLNLFHLWIPDQRRRLVEDTKATSAQHSHPLPRNPESSSSTHFPERSQTTKRNQQSPPPLHLPDSKRIRLSDNKAGTSATTVSVFENFDDVDEAEEPGSPDMFENNEDTPPSSGNSYAISATPVQGNRLISHRPPSPVPASDLDHLEHSPERIDQNTSEHSLEDQIKDLLDSDAEENVDDSDIEDFI